MAKEFPGKYVDVFLCWKDERIWNPEGAGCKYAAHGRRLCWYFFKIATVSLCVGLVISYYLMGEWLAVATFGLIAVSYAVVRAARINYVNVISKDL